MKKRFYELLDERGGQGPYDDSKTLLDHGLDSLQIIELMLACEDEWDITTGTDDTDLFYGPISKIMETIAERTKL